MPETLPPPVQNPESKSEQKADLFAGLLNRIFVLDEMGLFILQYVDQAEPFTPQGHVNHIRKITAEAKFAYSQLKISTRA